MSYRAAIVVTVMKVDGKGFPSEVTSVKHQEQHEDKTTKVLLRLE